MRRLLVAQTAFVHPACARMSFDSLAAHYRWMEFVLAGQKLQHCRTAFLDQASECQSALLMGEGIGRFLVEYRRRSKQAAITCVDSSPAMLAQAKRRLRHSELGSANLHFVHADARVWHPPKLNYDLIVTHFFLDCFDSNQLRQVMTRLADAASPSAMWLHADFCVPLSGLTRFRALLIHRLMYGFFRFMTGISARAITPVDSLFTQHGFELRSRVVADWGLLHSDLWQRQSIPATQ